MLRQPQPSAAVRGRSRFSKALPSVPGLVDAGPKQLPRLPDESRRAGAVARKPVRLSSSPPPPPPKTADPRLQSEPAPTPRSEAPQTAAPRSAAPRSAAPKLWSEPVPTPWSEPAQTPRSAGPETNPKPSSAPPSGAPAPLTRPHVGPAAGLPASAKPLHRHQPSPTDSLSSLLSAYSRDPDDLPSGASTSTVATTVDGDGRASPPASAAAALPTGPRQQAPSPAAAPAPRGPPAPPAPLQPPTQCVPAVSPAPASASASASAAATAVVAAAPPVGLPASPSPHAHRLVGLRIPDQRSKADQRPASPASKPQPELATPSPPRPELWRRRPHKSDTSRDFPGLKLDRSHGSTAATSQTTAPTAAVAPSPGPRARAPPSPTSSPTASPPKPTAAATAGTPPSDVPKPARPQPRPGVVGLPGRNVRPAAKQQPKNQEDQVQQADSRAMGHRHSKLDQFKDALHLTRSSADDSSVATKNKLRKTPTLTEAAPRPGVQRPPTPEYHKGDAKAAPAVDTVVSPESPVSSSTSPRPAQVDGAPEQPPPPDVRGPEHPGSKPAPTILRKTLPASAPNLLAIAGSGSGDGPLAALKQQHLQQRLQPPSDDISRGRTLEPAGRATPPPRNPSVRSEARATPPPRNPSIRSEARATPPPRNPSVRSEARAPAVQWPRRPTEGEARIVHSETHGPLYRGRDGTLYPEMKVTREPDPRAAHFPLQTEQPPEPGTVFAARPLRNSHFDCYQRHRTMNRLSNRNYPLTCQTCDKADTEDRWVCTFCHLRICETCLRALDGYQRVLRRLVDELASSTPLSLSSTSRPGSVLGLQLAS